MGQAVSSVLNYFQEDNDMNPPQDRSRSLEEDSSIEESPEPERKADPPRKNPDPIYIPVLAAPLDPKASEVIWIYRRDSTDGVVGGETTATVKVSARKFASQIAVAS